LSELDLHYKSLLTRVYDHAGCKEYCKDFIVALTIFDVFNKTQMYSSVITGKEKYSKNWNCIISIFLTSFIIYFVFGYAYEEAGRRGGKGETIPGRRKVPTMSQTSTFFDTVQLLRKNLRFEHGSAKLTSCPGSHLTSLRPCMHVLCVYVLRSLSGILRKRTVFFWRKQVGNPAKQQTQQH